MEEVKKENENVSNKVVFEFEMSYISISRVGKDDTHVCRDFLHNIFHMTDKKIDEYDNLLTEENKQILVGPYARDLAKSLVYRTTCYLSTLDKDTDYIVYIKEDLV